MRIQELTLSEQVLLSSVALGAILLTGVIILCVVWKKCWLHRYIWHDGKKKSGSDDIICIRYPPDIYPASVGIYRENILRSPEDELARLFSSPVKRDSTYSSMSDNDNSNASVYELAQTPVITSSNCSPVTGTPDSPDSASHLLPPVNNNNGSGKPCMSSTGRPSATAAEIEEATNKFNEQQLHLLHNNSRQPFFTFGLKYQNENGLVHIDFLEARNFPLREYLNQPCDVFFTLEIQPKKSSRSGSSSAPKREMMMRYRFVTKTLRKAGDICDFSEKFLAQLSKANLKDYNIRFTAFDQDRFGNPTELGSTTLTFEDFRDFTNHKLILSCSLKEPIIKRGEILVGLCYLPTAERMSVNIMKVTNMNPYFSHGTITKQSICYVRVFLLRADTGKVIKRKKTTYQRLCGTTADQPIFNETLVFDMPPTELIQTVLLVMVCMTDKINGNSPPSSSLAAKRHSTPERPGPLPVPSDHQRHRHSVDEALFHYSDNLNVSNSASSSRANSICQLELDSRRTSLEPVSEEQSRGTSVKSKDQVVGKVAFGYSIKNALGKAHWEKMIRAPRTIASEWHSLK